MISKTLIDTPATVPSPHPLRPSKKAVVFSFNDASMPGPSPTHLAENAAKLKKNETD